MQTTGCPTEEDLVAYSLGEMSGEEIERVSSHLEGCQRCEATARSLESLSDPMITSLRASPAPAPVPTRIGVYEILGVLGRGGMGVVFKARHPHLGRTVALKVLPGDRVADPSSVGRFLREMQAVGQFAHPNIVQATDAGETHGTYFLVMEFVEGMDLARLVRQRGPLAPADACELVRQAALGLQHSHDHGMIHRDVKPSNLMVTPDGRVKVLDLGLARFDGQRRADEFSTASGLLMGSFDYLSPEQADDPHAIDGRADLYSLGCTLFHLLAGRPPFAALGLTPMQALKGPHATQPPPVRSVPAGTPAGVVALLGKLLAKSPADRPATAAAVARALEPFAAGADLAALLRTTDETATMPRPAPADRPPRRGLLVPAVAALALMAFGAIVYVQTDFGLLEVATSDDDVKVSVEKGGKEVELLDGKTKKSVRLRAGTYRLVLVEGGKDRELDRDEFTMRRGDTAIATVRRVKRPVTLVPPAGKFPPLEAAWVKSVGEMSADDRAAAVEKELRRRNPDFKGRFDREDASGRIVVVSLPGNEVTDLTPLRALPHLKALYCRRVGATGKLADLSQLQGLPLEVLDVQGCWVEGLASLKGMPLRKLNLAFNPVKDLATVGTLRDLKELDISYTLVSDLTPLTGLSLESLNAFQSKASDLKPLRTMTSLKVLICGWTAVSDLAPIRDLALERLHVGWTSLSSLAVLKDMKTLKHLECPGTKVNDLSPLRALSLEQLDISDTTVSDLTPIKGMPLEALAFLRSKVTDLKPLRGMKSLKSLAGDCDPDRDGEVLRSLPALVEINDMPPAAFLKGAKKGD